jgi:hypothetical protein
MTQIYQDLRRKIPLQFIEGVPEGRGSLDQNRNSLPEGRGSKKI